MNRAVWSGVNIAPSERISIECLHEWVRFNYCTYCLLASYTFNVGSGFLVRHQFCFIYCTYCLLWFYSKGEDCEEGVWVLPNNQHLPLPGKCLDGWGGDVGLGGRRTTSLRRMSWWRRTTSGIENSKNFIECSRAQCRCLYASNDGKLAPGVASYTFNVGSGFLVRHQFCFIYCTYRLLWFYSKGEDCEEGVWVLPNNQHLPLPGKCLDGWGGDVGLGGRHPCAICRDGAGPRHVPPHPRQLSMSHDGLRCPADPRTSSYQFQFTWKPMNQLQ